MLIVFLLIAVVVLIGVGLYCFIKHRAEKRKQDKLAFYQAQHRLNNQDDDGTLGESTAALNDDVDDDEPNELNNEV